MERKLGRYELLRRLAKGGMGEIYLARVRGAGGFEKTVILKTILPHLAEEEEFVTKFLDEGRIVVQLTHGNIVPVFDMGEQNGEYFIAMEYVPGQDLRAILKRLKERREELPVEFALYIAAEIAKGLGYAHRKMDASGNPLEIVHRDVSPSNVLISHEGEVKLIDFGIARAAGKLSQTANGAIQGKCCYMSPEQARGHHLDSRSDIFSAGVVLYEMLTLVRPFEGRNDLESLELVRTCTVDPPGVLRTEISEELDEILLRALADDPDDRYQTIDELYVDLQHEMYRLGHTVTSSQLAISLREVLCEDSQFEAPRPANLDEALELELARISESSEATPSRPSRSSQNREEDLLSFALTETRAKGTRTLSPLAGPTPATVLDPASSHSSESHSFEGHHEDQLNESIERSSQRVSSSFSTDSLQPTPSNPTSWKAGLIVAILFLTGAAAILFWVLFPGESTLFIDSDPQGAVIHLNGEELVGRLTPAEIFLSPGRYSVELSQENYRPRRFRVELSRGERLEIGPEELRLTPLPQQPRSFQVSVDHPEATLQADGEELENSTATFTLEPGDVINLVASAPECVHSYYTLTYNHQREEIPIRLDCPRESPLLTQRPGPEDQPRAQVESPRIRRPASRRVLIESRPQGAEVLVDQEMIGRTPLYATLPEDRMAIIEARREGYVSATRSLPNLRNLEGDRIELTLQEAPRGCLTLRTMYPANNEITLNGTRLPGRHMLLRDHALPAGRNEIKVHHPESGKKETFVVEIEAGPDCKVLTVWERDG